MIIIASKSGQLGNRLFQFAHFIAFSRQHGVTIWNPGFEEYADSFEGTFKSPFSCYPAVERGFIVAPRLRSGIYGIASRLAYFIKSRGLSTDRLRALFLEWGQEFQLDDPAFEASICKYQILFAYGFEFRARSYFATHAEAIRSFFTPRQHHLARIEPVLAAARGRADIVIGVHIRGGDYKEYLGGKYFFELADYLKIMEATQRLFAGKRVCFLVCSNERLDVNKFSSFDIVLGPGLPVEDLYTFARCDYLLGPPSSFTLWAAFYGECPLYQVWDRLAFPSAIADFRVPSEEKRVVM